MRNLNIVQFVSFETTLASDQFIRRWEEYHRSENSDMNVTLQQREGEKIYKYLAQHRGAGNELRFLFSKGASSPRVRREIITTKQAGGYLVLQEERMNGTRGNETLTCILFMQVSAAGYRGLFIRYYPFLQRIAL